MELWIRSQDKESLLKIENISINNENWVLGNLISDDNKCICDYWKLGHYETKERALEVLDEIQSKLKQQFIVKADVLMSNKDIDMEEIRLNYKYNKDFIIQDSGFEIIPVNDNVLIYEMPKE